MLIGYIKFYKIFIFELILCQVRSHQTGQSSCTKHVRKVFRAINIVAPNNTITNIASIEEVKRLHHLTIFPNGYDSWLLQFAYRRFQCRHRLLIYANQKEKHIPFDKHVALMVSK